MYHNGNIEEKIKIHIHMRHDLQAKRLWATQFSKNYTIEEKD